MEEARAQREAAQNYLAELKAEIPAKNSGVPLELMRRTKALLERLETGSFAINASVPEDLLSAMAAVHEAVNSLEPVQHPTLDTPLCSSEERDEQQDNAHSCEGRVPDSAPVGEDAVMETLDGIDESDDEALLDIARRLKRARRM